MKNSVKFLAVAALFFLTTSAAFSSTVTQTWTDNTNNWANWGTAGENGTDYIGQPDITGGTNVIQDGFLKTVTINYANPPGWTSTSMKPGDLFLDVNSDSKWDYVVSLYNGNSNSNDNRYNPTSPLTSAPIYEINLALGGPASTTTNSVNSFGYLVTGANDISSYWSNANIRNNEPFAVTGVTSASLGNASVTFSGNSLIFNLGSANIVPVSGQLTIGFATNCANDVVYDTAPVPEPGTLVMLSSGLLMGIGLIRLKKS